MVIDAFRGYQEAADLSKIRPGHLAYPSRNVFVTKGSVVSRTGLLNDGTAHTVDEAVHSEFVWKDAPGGRRALRVHGTTLQVKHLGKWVTLFTGLDADTTRVFFATWVDANTTVIKKRLFFVDGSRNVYQWNGFIGTVASYDGGTTTVTFSADKANLGLMGADAGNVTTQNVRIYSLDGSGVVDATDTSRAYTTDVTSGLTMALNGAPSFTPVAGDLVMSAVTTEANAVSSTFNIDVIINYQNHLVCAQYDSVEVFFSHVSTYSLATGLDFTQPGSGSRTALTPIYLRLEGGFQGMITRKNVLWVSDTDDWYKVVKTVEVNAYDLWVDVEKFETGENKGCLPMAVARHKGDIIYMAKDLSLQRITTIDVIGKDDIQLLSDEVESLFRRIDTDDVRLYYSDRGIYLIFPQESMLVILDTSEVDENGQPRWYFQPPQDIPINCLSVIDGVKYGHHNARNESYEMFSGREDLGAEMADNVIALGLLHNTTQKAGYFDYKRHDFFAIDCRLTLTTDVLGERFYEEDGAKGSESYEFEGEDITTFAVEDDVSWATNPYGSRAWGGADMEVADLRRAFVWDRSSSEGHFEVRPIITVTGPDREFHLLGIYMDEKPSERVPASQGDDSLFIERNI
jgi:hypothetical protein